MANVNNVNVSHENKTTLEIDTWLARLDLVCSNGHNNMYQMKIKQSRKKICNCGRVITDWIILKCMTCKQILCRLCVIAASIWAEILLKNTYQTTK